MKKIVVVFCLILSVFFSFGVTRAHELLPKELLEYIQKNPNASPADIENYLNSKPDIYKNDSGYKDKIIQAVRSPKQGFFHNGYDFLKIGIQHILDGPDHILFVLSLLLVFTSLRDILKLTAVFTIAHSITLILAGSNLLVLGSRIVEPLIALSIAYVAITTVFFKHISFFHSLLGKQVGIFIFGLFHGLGFAGLLSELGVPGERFISSLLSFNVGIEFGQIIIVAIALPFILRFHKKLWYGKIIKVAAAAISGLALFWFIQRIFF